METGEIIQIFAESGFQIDPAALDMLKTSGSPELIKKLLCSIDSSVMVVGAEHIRGAPVSGKNVPGITMTVPKIMVPPKFSEVKNPRVSPLVTVLKDISN